MLFNAMHKVILTTLFYDSDTGNERKFPMTDLPVAASCFKKLRDVAGVRTQGADTFIDHSDGEIEFTPEEAAFLRDQLAGLTEAVPSLYESIEEVKRILNP